MIGIELFFQCKTAIAAAGPPSLISMAGGMPNADLFPIKEASLTLRMSDILQWVKKLQKEMHNPPTLGIKDPERQLDVLITAGSQDGICKPYIPSFLSMDEDGRVVRFDSFSKLLSGGWLEIGLNLCEVLRGSRQDMAAQTVSIWFVSVIGKATKKSLRKLDANSGLAEWYVPSGGMFLWIRLLNITDSFQLIAEKAQAAEVLFVPGRAFMVDETAPTPYIRASYSLVSPEDMDKAFQRLAALLKEEAK
nr:hypothetical protein BaRGS_020471 [Batillaria attramentaria]